jgi:hypothetical protein
MSQVLGAFGLLVFTMLLPFSLGAHFETYEPFISLIFQFFCPTVNREYGIIRYGGTTVYHYSPCGNFFSLYSCHFTLLDK